MSYKNLVLDPNDIKWCVHVENCALREEIQRYKHRISVLEQQNAKLQNDKSKEVDVKNMWKDRYWAEFGKVIKLEAKIDDHLLLQNMPKFNVDSASQFEIESYTQILDNKKQSQ